MQNKELIKRLQTVYEESTLGDIPIIIKELQEKMEVYKHTDSEITVITGDLINNDIVDTPCKMIELDRVVLNTIHFAVQAVETDEGVVIDVFHRNGELIDSYTYWNDDVTGEDDPENYIMK